MWRPQIDSYPPQLRGHGGSGKLQTDSTAEWVEDPLTILAAEHVERYALVGVSMGGIIAHALAIADRERVTAACDMDQVIRARRIINAIEHKAHLEEINVPTLQIVGAKAGEFFVALNHKVSATMPNSTLPVLPDGTDPVR